MTYIANKDFLLEVAKGNIPGHTLIRKFGRNPAVGTTFVPVTRGGVYQTPQPAAATTLRIKAGGNANDTAAGSGAREVTLVGLNASGVEVTEALATAGASASAATSNSFIRLYSVYVSKSGTYATSATGSHSAAITIENSAGGTDWAVIGATGYPKSRSEIGAFSVPTGYTAYLLSADIHSDTSKTTEIALFQRTGILQAAAPYDAMQLIDTQYIREMDEVNMLRQPLEFEEDTDFGFMALVDTGTAQVSVSFDILLVQN